jgi:hypothetical protein
VGSGGAEEELCQQVGLRNVRAMAGWNLNRLDPEPLASHPTLPIWADRAIFGGDDVRGGNLVAERDALVESGDRQEEPARGQGPVERRLVAVVVEEARSNRVIGRGVLTDPFRIEGRLRMLSHLFAEARVRIGHPGGEPHLVASIERTSSCRQQDAGAGMRDDDGLANAVNLSADDPCVLIRSEFRLVGWEIDRVRAVPTALERRNEALPAGRRLARAVDEDEVAQIARPSRVIQARAPCGSVPRAGVEPAHAARVACAQTLTTRSNCSVIRANSGGVSQVAFSHVRSSSVAPRATAQPFQT